MYNQTIEKMSLSEIKADKEEFLRRYCLKEEFEKSGYDWEELMRIATQFDADRNGKYQEIVQKYINEIATFEGIHSYRYRIKETDSLIKKIITKANKTGKRVTFEDYLTKITDLIGIRVLYVFKEDYYRVHQQIMEKYQPRFVENVHIKLQVGDEEGLYEKIHDCSPIIETNKIYRSIHYTLNAEDFYNGARLEIQTRTIFEEGWSEINHMLVYKNQDVEDYFVLSQASKILSTLVGNCDTLGMLMKSIYDEYMHRISGEGNSKDVIEDNSQVMKEILNEFLMS